MVPTLGDYFRAAGYRTHYRGKWHISHEDIEIPGSHSSLLSNTTDGTPILENTDLYRRANRLDKFGFDGWIGPEPHGSNQAKCGWTRDPLYCKEALGLLDRLDSDPEASEEPWLIVNSYVNPHDIVFFGLIWKSWGLPYPTDADVPPIPPPPNEDLSTKPARSRATSIRTGRCSSRSRRWTSYRSPAPGGAPAGAARDEAAVAGREHRGSTCGRGGGDHQRGDSRDR